jgi:protein-disulfide isomerase
MAAAVGVVAALALIVVAQVVHKEKAPAAVSDPVVDLRGVPQHGAVLGQTGPKVKLIEYADQQCPGCRYYTLNIFPGLVKRYVRPGRVQMEYRGFPFIGSDSVKALRFLLAAGKQNRLWDLQEALYRHEGVENSGWITDDLIRQVASEIPGLDVDKLFADAQTDAIAQEAEAQQSAAEAADLPGTPTFFIQVGNQKPYYIDISSLAQFREALDAALSD